MAQNKATIIVFSGDMDKVFAAFLIATGAAAAGMDTTLFFTFWGLNAIQKGNWTGKGFMAKMLGLLNRGGVNRLGPSKFNFGGMGRWMFMDGQQLYLNWVPGFIPSLPAGKISG